MSQRLKTDYTGKGRWKVVANGFNAIGRILNGLVGFDGIEVEAVGDETRFYFRGETGGGLDLRKFAFGWVSTLDQTVTLAAGYIEGRYGYRTVAGKTVSVGGNETAKHLIIATGDDTTGEIEPNSVLESAFSGDTADRWRRVLYRVYLKNGKPVMDMVGQGVGGIVL